MLLGGEPVCLPTIEVVPPVNPAPLDQVLDRIRDFDWLVFTSANGVRSFLERMKVRQIDIRQMRGNLAAIGPVTEQVLRDAGLQVAYHPEEYRAEALLAGLLSAIPAGSRVLLPRAAEAREVLPEGLRRSGLDVEVVPAYRTVPAGEREKHFVQELLAEGRINYLTFTSSSAGRNFVRLFSGSDLQQLLQCCRIVCIGPVTAATITDQGLAVDLVADQYTTDGMLQLIVKDVADQTKRECS
jgi:uroporphyrinogen III methyltransferase/synthase